MEKSMNEVNLKEKEQEAYRESMLVVVMVVALFILFGDISVDLWYRWSPTFMGAMLTGALTYLVGKWVHGVLE